MQQNGAVAALTFNNIPNLETLAEDIRRTKSYMYIEKEKKEQDEGKPQEFNKFKTAVISPGAQDPTFQEKQREIDAFIVDSSVGSIISDESEQDDMYSNSILISS